MFKNVNLRKKIAFLLTLVTFLSILIIVFFVSNLIKKEMMKSFEKQVKITEEFVNHIVIDYKAKSLNYARLINQDPEIGKATEYADLGNPDDLRHKMWGIYKKLDLTLLGVTNTKGKVLFRAHKPEKFGDTIHNNALKDSFTGKITVDMFRDEAGYSIRAIVPLGFTGFAAPQDVTGEIKNIKGSAITGFFLDNRFAEMIKELSKAEFSVISMDGEIFASSHEKLGDTRIDKEILTRVEDLKDSIYKEIQIDGERYFASYRPIMNNRNDIIGLFMIGASEADMIAARRDMFFNLFLLAIFVCAIAGIIGFFISKRISDPIGKVVSMIKEIAGGKGDLTKRIEVRTSDEVGELANEFNMMADRLGEMHEGLNERTRELQESEKLIKEERDQQEALRKLVTIFNSTIKLSALLQDSIAEMVSVTGSQVGAIFLFDKNRKILRKRAGFAMSDGDSMEFNLGEGLPGQVALNRKKIIACEISRSEDYFRIKSGTGGNLPGSILCVPILLHGEVVGVIEIGCFGSFSVHDLEIVDITVGQLAIAIRNAQAHERALRMRKELQFKSEEMERQNKRLQEATRLKSEFLANMSHELRTPLNSIIGFTDQLLLGFFGEVSEKQREQMNKVHSSAKHLLSLLNDVLDLSKVEAGRMDFKKEEFRLHDSIKEVLTEISGLLTKKEEIEVKVDIQKDIPMVYTDYDRIRQILFNLIGNAIKFTKKGEIVISASYENNSDYVHVSVRDTGIGISKEYLSYIFDSFRQVDGSTTRSAGGTGLGLTISKRLVEMSGGQIWVESEIGKGSVFTFSLPIRPDVHTIIEDEKICPDKKLVLAIEDNEQDLEIIKNSLEVEGYQVIGVLKAREGIEKAKELKPFAITLDILMPEIDGWEVMKILKSDPDTENIPVIMTTITDNRSKGFSLGASEYIVKPIDQKQFISTIKRLKDWRFSTNGQHVLIVDDDPDAVELLSEFLEREDYHVLKAFGGEEAIEIIEKERPSMVITDLMMPVVDGFEVIRRVRSDPAMSDIPIIVVTAKELTMEERKFINEHVEDIAAKGDIRTMTDEINSILKRVHSSKEQGAG